jgi:hypothetical protein
MPDMTPSLEPKVKAQRKEGPGHEDTAIECPPDILETKKTA